MVESKLLNAVLVNIDKESVPSEAIEPLCMILSNFPGSRSQLCPIFSRSMLLLENANNSPDQEKVLEETLGKFITKWVDQWEEKGEKGTTKAAFDFLERLSPQRAAQLRNEIPQKYLQAKGI